MNLDTFLSLVRAVMMAVGTSAATIGVGTSEQWTAISGGVLAAASLAWSMYHHSVVAPARIVTASSETAKAMVAGTPAPQAAAQGASIAGASDATIAAARSATNPTVSL
jgi:hypothetical protein